MNINNLPKLPDGWEIVNREEYYWSSTPKYGDPIYLKWVAIKKVSGSFVAIAIVSNRFRAVNCDSLNAEETAAVYQAVVTANKGN